MKNGIIGEQGYGKGAATFNAMGGEAGIRRLVENFYQIMGSETAYQKIFSWHPSNKEISIDKLTRFLCGWSGGPRLYQDKYGSISIPAVHKHLAIDENAKDMWLECMHKAMQEQTYPAPLVEYLDVQFSAPANLIQDVCSKLQN